MRRGFLVVATVLVVGCGEDPTHESADSSPDAPTAPAATVTVWDHVRPGEPARATVLVHRADGSVRASVETDVEGRAVAVIEIGDRITVIWPYDQAQLLTIAAVEPGDELVVGPPRPAEGASPGTLTVTVPAAPAVEVDIGCARAGDTAVTELPVPLATTCPATGAVLALAYDETAILTGYAVASAAALHGGGSVTMPAWSVDFATSTLAVVDAVVGRFYLASASTHDAGMSYATVVAGSPAEGPVTLQYPKGLASLHEWRVQAVDAGAATIRIHREAGVPPSAVLGPADFLPTFDAPTFAGERVSWSFPGGDVDGSFVRLDLTGPEGPVRWEIVLPPGVTELELPPLPPGLAPYVPDDDLPEHAYIARAWMVEASHLDADGFRATAGTGWPVEITRDTSGLPAGDLRVSTNAPIE